MKKMFQSTFILTVFLFSFVSAAWGAPCPPGSTLDVYIGLSSGCEIGTTLFSDFESLSIPNAATQISPSSVIVNPLNDLNGPGLEFVVDKTALAGQFFDVRIGYIVSNNTFSGITLSMTGSSATGDGVVTTIEDIWPGELFDPNSLGILTLIVFDNGIDKDTFEQLTFDPVFGPVTFIGVIKDIGIDGGLGGTGVLQSATNQFTVETPAAIPEPATILLVATGLGYLSIRRRRRT